MANTGCVVMPQVALVPQFGGCLVNVVVVTTSVVLSGDGAGMVFSMGHVGGGLIGALTGLGVS